MSNICTICFADLGFPQTEGSSRILSETTKINYIEKEKKMLMFE